MATQVGSIYYDLDLDKKKFDSGIAGANKSLGGLKSSLQNAERGSLLFAGALATAGAGAIAFGASSVKAFQDQEDALARLNAGIENVLTNTGGMKKGSDELAVSLKNASKALQDQASGLQKHTRFADEEIISGQAMLTTFQLNSKTIEKLTPSMLDMAEAMRRTGGETMDLSQLGIMFGKVMGNAEGGVEGMATGLKKMGVIMTDAQKEIFTTGTETERASTLVKIMSENFGGFADAGGKTFSGAMTIAKNTVNDFQELVGAKIVSVIQPAIDAFTAWTASIGGAEGMLKLLEDKIKTVEPYLPVIIGMIVGGLIPAFAALGVSIWTAMAPLIPFLAVGAALGYLINLLVKHFGGWDAAVAKLQVAFDALKEVFNKYILPNLQALWNEIQTNLLPALKELWDLVSPYIVPILKVLGVILGATLVVAINIIVVALRLLIAVITILVDIVRIMATQIIGYFQKLYDFLVGRSLIPDLINGIVGWFKKLPTMILSALSGIYNAITKPFKDAFDALSKMADDVWTKLQKINPFARHSPSLIDNVTKGMRIIESEINSLHFNVPSISSAFSSDLGSTGSSSTTQQNINVYVDKMGNNMDLQAVGRELGFRASLIPNVNV